MVAYYCSTHKLKINFYIKKQNKISFSNEAINVQSQKYDISLVQYQHSNYKFTIVGTWKFTYSTTIRESGNSRTIRVDHFFVTNKLHSVYMMYHSLVYITII